MLTKKKLHTWLNIALIVGTIACAVLVALLKGPSVGEKALLIAGYAGALKAALPVIKKSGDDAIDSTDLPEDEPKTGEAAK